VLAHELAHVRNADFRAMSWLLYAVVAADTFHDPDEFEASSVADWVFRWYAGAVSVLPRVAAGTVGRGREFAADRGAAAVTGDPAALAAALERLEGDPRPERDARLAFAAANVVPLYDPSGLLARTMRTHPDTGDRVRRLRAMVR
jgi:heat shock protein HtpX